jgi:hypothetical protein
MSALDMARSLRQLSRSIEQSGQPRVIAVVCSRCQAQGHNSATCQRLTAVDRRTLELWARTRPVRR